MYLITHRSMYRQNTIYTGAKSIADIFMTSFPVLRFHSKYLQ